MRSAVHVVAGICEPQALEGGVKMSKVNVIEICAMVFKPL